MASIKHPLFLSQRGWDLKQLPADMKGMDTQSSDPDCYSEYHDGAAFTRVNAFVARAIDAYCKRSSSDTNGLALVKIGDGSYAAEHLKSDGSFIIFQINANGKCQGAVRQPSGRFEAIPTIGSKSNEFDCTAIFLCLLMRICEESSNAKQTLEMEEATFAATGAYDEKGIYRLCDAVYYSMKSNQLKCNMTGGNVELLTQSAISLGTLNGTVVCGTPQVIMDQPSQNPSSGKVTFVEAKKKFSAWADAQSWSEEEKKLIPVFPDDYIVMPETMKLCSRYVNTHGDKRPMVNFMWRGITSFGKSTGVSMMAALLNMPLLHVTCSSTMEVQDFLSNIVPVGDRDRTVMSGSLPSFEDMSFDPVSAYFEMTGMEKEDATPQECLEVYGRKVAESSGDSGSRLFKQVKSPFVTALEHGYIVEVQEISRIKDSGVLVGLNEYDRPGSVIPLVDGGTVTRHPNAVVVFTDNVGYASCRDIDPSVLRRMAFILDSYTIPKADALERVVYNTGFADMDMLENMYEVWEKIQAHCADKDITEGTVSLTELEMWAQCVIADGYSNTKENCIDCVVAKATSVPEEQAEIISAVVNMTLKV